MDGNSKNMYSFQGIILNCIWLWEGLQQSFGAFRPNSALTSCTLGATLAI